MLESSEQLLDYLNHNPTRRKFRPGQKIYTVDVVNLYPTISISDLKVRLRCKVLMFYGRRKSLSSSLP